MRRRPYPSVQQADPELMSATRRTRPAWFPRVTLRGGAFLIVGGVLLAYSLVGNRRDLVFIACLLIAIPLVAMVYVTVRPARLGVERIFRPPIVPAGGDTIVSLRVRNLSLRPLYGARWRDGASEGITAVAGAQLPSLDSHEGGPAGGADSVILDYTLTPRVRGVYDVGPLVLGRHDPFGLAWSERAIGTGHDLTVTPRITPLPGNGLSDLSGEGTIHELHRQINPNSDELIAREYRPGDSMRRVNWPATARHGEIMVRQEEQRSNPDARIILDTTLSGDPLYSAEHGGERAGRLDQAFELAIELTASVGVHLLDSGFRLEVVELGRSQFAPDAHRERGGLHGDSPSAFLSLGGDRMLLEGLANVVPVDRPDVDDATMQRPRTATHSINETMPTFAVLVDIDEQDAVEIAEYRPQCQPAVAFVLDTMSRAAVTRLQDAGWRCIGLRSPKDIPAAWDEVQRERGGAHDAL